MIYTCGRGCSVDPGWKKPPATCDKHGARFTYEKPLKRETPLNRVSEKNTEKVRKQGSTLKPGRGFSASPEQQWKVKGLPCVVCGRDEHEGVQIQAAHVYPRRLQTCECAEGVVPMCAEDHRLYDQPDERFDLLPHLVSRCYHRESVHAIAVHGAPISELLRIVTGVQWVPANERKEKP